MGMPKRTRSSGSLADALFSATQQRVLAQLFGQPDRTFYANELISLTGGGSGAIQRELARLERSGLITSERRGAQKHYQANSASPLFDELCSIARKTVALVEPLREALKPLASRIKAAFVYGSVAKRQDTARSDIDLMVVSDSLDFQTLVSAVYELDARLGRPINPHILTIREFAKRRQEGSGFVGRVADQPKLWIIGKENDLPA
jgi:predicted nucleotidyltransferase